ncbi:dehydrogenase/reductase SDR family member 9-like [Amblyomma americanum]
MEEEYMDIASLLAHSLYVDDLLTEAENEEGALKIYEEARTTFSASSMTLHKGVRSSEARAWSSVLPINRLLVLVTPCLWALGSTVPVVQQISATFGFALLTLLVGYWSLWYGRRLLFNGSVKPNGKAVLITGCDTGFGHHLAEWLASDGFLVFAGCLDASGVGARALNERAGIHVLQMDVTVQEEVDAAVERVENELGNRVLWAVVCNAGVGSIGYINLQPMSRVRRVFDVNTFGVLSVATAFLPLVKKAGGGLVIVSSLLGRLQAPLCLAYSISKRAAISLADGLRRQYYATGVHVCTVEPTGYRTAITDRNLLEKEMDSDLKMLRPKIREGLDERFVNRTKLASRRLMSWFLRDDPREAAHVMRTAVLELVPKAHYTCGGCIDHIYRLLMDLLPAEVIDEGMHMLGSAAGMFSKRKC